jgi:hypothetical protein
LCYNPTVMHPHFQRTRTHNHYLYLSTLCNVYAFFVIYDMFILLKFTPPKRRFWKAEQTFQNAFSKHFSMV